MVATGGVVSDYTDPSPGKIYRSHVFTSSGTFNVTDLGDIGGTIEYLVVGGGAGGAVITVLIRWWCWWRWSQNKF